jgi:Calcineurin-like phosphoesterase
MTMIKKIVHLADIHIRKIPTRNDEYEKVFKKLIKSIKQKKPDLIVIVGDLLNDYLDLQSEQIILAVKLLRELAKIAPVRITRGNHDCRKKNLKRIDPIRAIVDIISDPNIIYYDKTRFYDDDNITWAVWHHGEPKNNPWKSKEGKSILANPEHNTTIDLFHDPINGCTSDNGFELKDSTRYKIKEFMGEYSFFGDIHRMQFFGNKKAYCGSLIAQKFSEGDDQFHGYLLWDLESGTAEEVAISNEYSFKNIQLTPFTDFEDIDIDIDEPTKNMKGRIVWSTLPSMRNNENERKLIDYLQKKYPDIIISHKNEFSEDDTINIDNDVEIEDITNQDVQHTIFREYLEKIGVDDEKINTVIALDIELTSKITLDDVTHIEWSVVKFGCTNFMSYNGFDIDWRDMDGLYQITGINTAGKTTIFKLISYILFNKTIETEFRVKFGDRRFVNNKTDLNYCDSYMVIDANGEYYGIKRRTQITTTKKGEITGAPTAVSYYTLSSPDSEMNDDNSIDNLTEDDRIKTQKTIDQIIGSYDNFNRVVLTTSDTMNRILSNDMAVFIDTLLFDSGLDVFDKKNTALSDHRKELNKKSRITCNVETTNENTKKLEEDNVIINNEIDDIEKVKVPEIDKNIKKGQDYVEKLTKKLHTIDEDIQNLDVESTEVDINTHNETIKNYTERQSKLNKDIKPLKKTYDKENFDKLTKKKDDHKQQESESNLEKKEKERLKGVEDHNIEIINGNIFRLKEDGANKKQEVNELRESKNCPTCGQALTDLSDEHKKFIDEKVKVLIDEMYDIGGKIKIEEKSIKVHEDKVDEYLKDIKTIESNKLENTADMETILSTIGELTNDKDEVDKRNEYQIELDQIPVKTENEEMRAELLQTKIDKHDQSLIQIDENKKNEKIIKISKDKLGLYDSDIKDHNENIIEKKTKLNENLLKIKQNNQLVKEFEEQEYQDSILDLYKKCVHRDGIPKQLLGSYVIPKINNVLGTMLDNVSFKIWLDVDDLRPKLAYNNTPTAIIDAIGSSGKERTFASIVLKNALNQINVKSKPTICLLDEVMDKLSEESIEEFIEILQLIKNKVKKLIIVQHKANVEPDYVIDVHRNSIGISNLEIR